MTTYAYKNGEFYDPDGGIMPKHKRVAVSKLEVTSIVFLRNGTGDVWRSAVVTAIEPVPDAKQKVVTLVDGTGLVEKVKAYPGEKKFELQCAQETLDADHERELNISLRRRLAKLNGEVCANRDSIKNMLKTIVYSYSPSAPAIQNPKVKDYVARFDQFAADLQNMYDEVGEDLGITSKRLKPKGTV